MKVLVVEDDLDTREGLGSASRGVRSRGVSGSTLAEARARLATFDPDVCLTDLQLPDGDGIEFVREARAGDPRREIVVLTGHGTLDSAVEAMKAGAFDYLLKPLKPVELEAVLGRLRAGAPAGDGGAALWKALDETGRFGAMVGVSSAMREMCAVIARVARSDAPVMITGESGSGKEAAAQTIHDLSRRRDKPLVAINCGAVSANLIESELFGHEKGAFTGADRKAHRLLRAGAGRDALPRRGHGNAARAPGEAAAGPRNALVPPGGRKRGARQRRAHHVELEPRSRRGRGKEDASRGPLLSTERPSPSRRSASREARRHADAREALPRPRRRDGGGGRRRFSAAALERLASHGWPGNVRELRNAVHRAYVLSDSETIDEDVVAAVLGGRSSGVFRVAPPPAPAREPESDAPPPPVTPSPEDPLSVPVHVGDSLEEAERRLLERTLAAVGGNKRKAAEMLRVSLKTVYNKIKQYDLER